LSYYRYFSNQFSDWERKIMDRYKNLGGDSGVIAYEIGIDFIKVQFSDGSIYLYNYQSTGASDIEEMKRLAVAGQGLNSFISRIVKKRYAARLS
jgi:hypothetical protein